VETEAELKAMRQRLARGTPFDNTHWQTKTAAFLGFDREAGQNNSKVKCPFYFSTDWLIELLSLERTRPSCMVQR
jgi:hypothetical protein